MNATLLCLHGWGGSKESFTELREALKGAPIEILTPDLPGFGGEPEPPCPWSVDDYADWVSAWVEKHCSELPHNRILLGHSFGGRIAIKLAARRKLTISHLLLCAAAGIKHDQPAKQLLGMAMAKSGKILLSFPPLRALQNPAKKILYKILHVHDYECASPRMRATMERVTAEDLRPLLKEIAVPTDIFWGEEDTMTPLEDARIMQQEIAQSTLHTYPHVRHRVHRDKAQEIAQRIRSIIEHA